MKRLIYCFLILLSLNSLGQPLSNKYFFDKYSLSPVYACFDDNTWLMAGYRNERVSFPGAPVEKWIDVFSQVGDRMAFGGSFVTEQAGILRFSQFDLGYGYYVNLNDDHILGFSLKAGMAEDRYDLSSENADEVLLDPFIGNRLLLHGTALNLGAGVLYKFKGLSLGVELPSVIENKFNFGDYQLLENHKISRKIQIHGSYEYSFSDNWAVEPLFILRQTKNQPFNYEFAALLAYQKMLKFGMNYRKSGEVGFNLGANLKNNFMFSYTYEFGTSELGKQASGTHELGIAISLKQKSVTRQIITTPGTKTSMKSEKEIFDKIDSLNSYVKRLESDLTLLKGGNENNQLDTKILDLQNQINSLSKNLEGLVSDVGKIKEGGVVVTQKTDNQSGGQNNSAQIKGYYVILDSYHSRAKAESGINIWKKRGYTVSIIDRPESGWYHIYIDRFDDLTPALSKMKEVRASYCQDSWVLILK